MSKIDIKLDFSKPSDARKFLRDFRFPNGSSLELLGFPNGKTVNVLTVTDLEVGYYATLVHANFLKTGQGYLEDTEIH